MLNVEDWAEIRRLHRAEGVAIKEIVRRLGVSRNTVRSALRSEGPPVFNRAPRPSLLDGFGPAIRGLLAEHPRMPATTAGGVDSGEAPCSAGVMDLMSPVIWP